MMNDDTLLSEPADQQASLGGMLDLDTSNGNAYAVIQDEWKKIAPVLHDPNLSLQQRVAVVMQYFLAHFASLADPNVVDEALVDAVIYDLSTSILQVAIVNPIEEYEKMNPIVYGHAILSRIINDLHGRKMLSLSIYDLLQDWENRYGEQG